MADKKPLWEVMYQASEGVLLGCSADAPVEVFQAALNQAEREQKAAELRALADEVAPEEPMPFAGQLHEPDTYQAHEQIRWQQRMKIRQRFLDAAAEAEGKS